METLRSPHCSPRIQFSDSLVAKHSSGPWLVTAPAGRQQQQRGAACADDCFAHRARRAVRPWPFADCPTARAWASTTSSRRSLLLRPDGATPALANLASGLRPWIASTSAPPGGCSSPAFGPRPLVLVRCAMDLGAIESAALTVVPLAHNQLIAETASAVATAGRPREAGVVLRRTRRSWKP
jgi:hypothetical protein